MTSPQLYARAVLAPLIALSIGLAAVPVAAADPADTVQNDPAAPAPGPAGVPVAAPLADDGGSPAATACPLFANALDVSSTFYGDFADTIEGTERPDYQDPSVSTTSTSGRTALRQSAADALNAAGTPGLAPEISGPMRSWSLDATKLLLKMAVRTSGQSLNETAIEMNEDAGNAQMACASAGTSA